MKFNYTHGKTAKYIVTAYGFNVEDHYYFHYFKDAKKCFENLKLMPFEAETIISIYDLQKDERKAFQKI